MSSGFISEAEVTETRRRRQEEWERVRTDNQPLEVPEEPYDPRPLYQRLEEQKNKKDAEYEEAHKLKNMIRGLDDDEVGFLELVEQSKATVARQISLEEEREIKEFRERVSSVQDIVERERLQQISSIRQTSKKMSTNNTRNMLQGVIIRKRKISDNENDKNEQPLQKNLSSNNSIDYSKTNGHSNIKKKDEGSTVNNTISVDVTPSVGSLKCIGVLPGIGPYKDSSDSECSSDSDDGQHHQPQYDLLGRKHEPKEKTEKC